MVVEHVVAVHVVGLVGTDQVGVAEGTWRAVLRSSGCRSSRMDAPRVQEHRAAGHTPFWGKRWVRPTRLAILRRQRQERAVPSMQAIAPNALDRWHEHLALAIRRLRQPDFLAALVDAIHQLVPIESSMISLERKGHAPTLLYERGIAERFREAIIRRYFSRGYLLDPFCLAVEEGLPEGFYTLGEIAPTTSSRAPTTRPTTSAPERWRTSTTSSTSAPPRSSRSVSTTAFRRAATATPRSPPSPAWRRRCWSWPGSSAPAAPTSRRTRRPTSPRAFRKCCAASVAACSPTANARPATCCSAATRRNPARG